MFVCVRMRDEIRAAANEEIHHRTSAIRNRAYDDSELSANTAEYTSVNNV